MLKKLMFSVIVFTAGECVAYATVNRQAKRLAKRDNAPALVMLPERWHKHLYVAMSTDPTGERPVYPFDIL